MARQLFVIPVLHTREDMGHLGREVGGALIEGERAAVRWTEIRRRVSNMALDWPNVKVFQDGLPDTDPNTVRRIVQDVQGPNFDLLRWLQAQGADVIGTESPELLAEEYRYLRTVVTAKDPGTQLSARRAFAARAGALLAERDAYIARRIDENLPEGAVGLLFIGEAHKVAERLPRGVVVRPLPDGGPFEMASS